MSYAGKSDDVVSTSNSSIVVKQTEVVVPEKVSSGSKFKKFLSSCFGCMKKTEELIDGATDRVEKGIEIVNQIDELRKKETEELINILKRQ